MSGATLSPPGEVVNIGAGGSSATGRIVFGNSNGVTFGLSGSTITASVAAGGGSGVVQWSAGTLSQTRTDITFGDSNGVSFGLNTNGVITASVGAAGGGLTNIKVSAGTVSALRSDLTFGDGNGVSFGLDTNGVITGTVKTDYLTTAMASNRGSDFVQATAAFAGTNASGTIASDGISISVGAGGIQSNQTIGLYGSSNTTLTSSGTVDARSFSVRAIGSLTVGYSAGELILSAPNALTTAQPVGAYLTTARASNDAVGLNTALTANGVAWTVNSSGISLNVPAFLTTAMASNRGSDFVAATAAFAGTNASGTIASNGISVAVAAPIPIGTAVKAVASVGSTGTITRYAPEDHQHVGVAAFAVTNTGNTLGNTRSQVGTVYFAASGGITASQSTAAAGNDTVWLSVAAPVAQTNQTVGLYASSNTYLTSSGTVDARSLSFRGDKSITVGISSGEVVFSVGAYLTTAALSADSSKYAGTGFTTTTVAGDKIAGTHDTAGLKLAVPAYLTTSSQSVQTQMTGLTAGVQSSGLVFGTTGLVSNELLFVPMGGMILSQSKNGESATLSLVVVQGAVSTMGNTEGNTGQWAGLGYLAGTNNITLSVSTKTAAAAGITRTDQTIVFSGPTQTNQTLGLYAVSNTEGASSSSTFDARTISFQGKGAVSVGFSNGSVVIDAPSAAAGNVTFSAGGGSSGLASVIFSNSNNVSFGLGAGSIITATATFAGGGGIGGGVSTGGNTAGSTGTVTTGNIVFVGSGPISLSQSTGAAGSDATITINAPATSSLVGTNGITLSTNGSTISVGPPIISEYAPYDPQSILTNSGIGQNSLYFVPFDIPAALSAYRVNQFFSIATTFSASNGTATGQITNSMALYSRGAGTATDRLSTFWSGSWFMSWSMSSNTQLNINHPKGIANSTSVSQQSTGISNANATTYLAQSVGGFRMIPFPISLTLTPGRYWAAFAASSTTASTKYNVQLSVMQHTLGGQLAFAPMGTSSVGGAGSVFGPMAGAGTYSATSGAFPATIALTNSDIRMGASVLTFPYFNFSAYTTGVNAL